MKLIIKNSWIGTSRRLNYCWWLLPLTFEKSMQSPGIRSPRSLCSPLTRLQFCGSFRSSVRQILRQPHNLRIRQASPPPHRVPLVQRWFNVILVRPQLPPQHSNSIRVRVRVKKLTQSVSAQCR